MDRIILGVALLATIASSATIQLLDGLVPRVPLAMAITTVLVACGVLLRARLARRMIGDALLALGALSIFGWASALITTLPGVDQIVRTNSPAVAFVVVNATKLTSVGVLLVIVVGYRWNRGALLLTGGRLNGRTGIPGLRWGVAGPLAVGIVAGLFFTDPNVSIASANRDAVLYALAAVWPLLIAGPLINALAEEVLYRHALIGTMRPLLGICTSTVVSSAIFGIAHLAGTPGGWSGVGFTFAFGIVCALAMIQNHGTAWNVTIHFFADTAAVTTLVVASVP